MIDPLSAGIIAGGSLLGSVIGGLMQNSATDKANEQALALAQIQRADQLKQNAFNNKLAVQDRVFRDKEARYQRLLNRRAAILEGPKADSARRAGAISMLNAAKIGGRQ